jgi:type VI secretion system protein ImpC
LAAADAAIGERMRAVLHHPDFQRLEAAWRGVHFLVTGLELDATLQLHIVDIGKEELRADLQAAGADLRRSAAYRLLVERQRAAPDTPPWSVLVGDYHFGPGADDVAMLAALGAIAAQAGAPLLAAGADQLLGCDSLAATPDPSDWRAPDADSAARWQALRASPGASWLGLALPRLLLRLPYGKQTDRVEHFDFDEYDGAHASYLWGNAAFGCALLLGQSFQDNAWDLAPGELLDIGALPAHTVRRDSAAYMQACAETLLSERAADAILRLGLMPMLSFGNRDAVHLARSQSLAAPPQPLSGPWQL